jgi:ADYC domain-containing protein
VWTEYCLDASNAADTVLFQQGIDVDVVNADVLDRGSSYVTLSCRKGAIASGRSWGYGYRDTGTNDIALFDAALHMKRASYCGDVAYYTSAGTQIYIWDADSINTSSKANPANLYDIEAVWDTTGTTGALCVNYNLTNSTLDKRRHHDADSGGLGTWDGTCNGNPMPHCGVWLQTHTARLVSRAYSPAP